MLGGMRTCPTDRLVRRLPMLAAGLILCALVAGCIGPHGSDHLIAGKTSEPPKLVTDSSGHFRTRAQWPVGSPLYVGFRPSSVNASYRHSRTMFVRSELADSKECMWSILMSGAMYRMKSRPWGDEMRHMGTPPEPASSLRLTRRLERFRETREPLVLSSGTSTLGVRIEGTIDDVLKPVVLPDLDEAIVKRLNPMFHRRGWGERDQAILGVATYVACDHEPDDPRYPGMCQDLRRHPDVTFAAEFKVLHRGEVMAKARAWWRSTGTSVAPYNGELLLEDLAPDFYERDINDGQWSLRVSSDPDTALRDLGSTQYWKGDVTIPLRGTDARTWDELKAAGLAPGSGTDGQ